MNNENNVPIALTDKPERTLDMVAAEIRAFTAGMLNNAIEIGRRMVEAKAMLPYGQFGAWISENTGYSASAANNFMRLFDEYGAMQGSLFGASAESQTFGKLPPSKALALLAVPAEERETFAEEHDAEHTSVRELKRLIAERERERDEARRNAKTAQENATELEQQLNVAHAAERDYRKRIEELENAEPDALLLASIREEERKDAEEKVAAQLAESEQARENAEAAVKAAQAETEGIKRQLSDLEKSRVKETQEADATIERAKKEAVAELQAKLDEANAALEEANAAAQKASEEESKLRQELSEARKAASESKAAPVEDKAIAAFSFLFNQAKDTANHMRNIILTVRKTDAETAEKLSGIMRKLAEEIRRCAE